MIKRYIKGKDFYAFSVWFALGYLGVKLGQWIFPSIPPEAITAFFLGAFTMFVALTLYGGWLKGKTELQRQLAMDQFIKDQKADVEKQAKIDREIIEQLKQEHELSGHEQDKRLKALEQALKHLKRK